MANVTPKQVLSNNYAIVQHNNTDGIWIPLADVTGLSTTEAHPDTGDGRKVVAGLLERVFSRIQALPQAQRPVYMQIVKGQPNGVAVNEVNQSFTVTFRLSVAFNGLVDLADEPTST